MTLFEAFESEEEVIKDCGVIIESLPDGIESPYVNLTSAKRLNVHIIDRENITITENASKTNINLRNQIEIDALIDSMDVGKDVLIDITYIPMNIWSIIIRRLLLKKRLHKVIYKSSDNYENIDSGETIEEFHLSNEIDGIAPLPGFFRLSRPKMGQVKVFIPILGFQGSRAQYIIDNEIESDYLMFPLLGVPGIRSDYGRISAFQNRQIINQKGVYRNIHYYSAWSPFEVHKELEKIIVGKGNLFLKIAPLGSKPSSLGAVLFVMSCEKKGIMATLIFDHPKVIEVYGDRVGRVFVYDTYNFWENNGR